MVENRLAVCVVDDDASVRGSVTRLLSDHGYAVEAFDSALAFLEHEPCAPSCAVLIDVSMPGIDGIELVQRLRQAGRRERVVLMSARDDEATRRRIEALGAIELLRKPFVIDDVIAALGRAQPLSPS